MTEQRFLTEEYIGKRITAEGEDCCISYKITGVLQAVVKTPSGNIEWFVFDNGTYVNGGLVTEIFE